MSKPPSKGGFYAVHIGRIPGVYHSWVECERQVSGFGGAKYKKFTNAAEAEAYANGSSIASVSTAAKTTAIIAQSSSSSSKPNSARTSVSTGEKANQVVMRPSRTAIDGLEEWDVVYTDGACSNNGKVGAVAGIGVWWGHDHPSNISERCPGDQTNNRAELIALIRVLESTPIGTRPLLIKTDSQYSMNCVNTWLPGWERNNWRSANGNPVKNKPLIQYLSVLLRARHHFKQKVELAYVKGHSGDEGNDGADGLAVAGTREAVRPDRDWDGDRKKLEEQMEKGGIPVTIGNGAAPMPAIAAPPAMKKSTVVVDDAMDLDFYADGLLDDDDLERDLADL